MNVLINPLTALHLGKMSELEHRLDSSKKFLTNTSNLKVPDGVDFLHLGHSLNYIEAIKQASNLTGNFYGTHFTSQSYDVAKRGVELSILAAETKSFVLTRPPGHHAGYNLPSKRIGLGDCIFNNVAIASKYLRNQGKKVLVLDIDLHQGNGTQDILGDEENIVVVDTSQKSYWPWYESTSKNCVNVQFQKGVADEEYLKGLKSNLIPLLKQFKPDVIGVSAGFDAHLLDRSYLVDPLHSNDLSYFNLTNKSFSEIHNIIQNYPHFAVLEGGYNSESVCNGIEIFTTD